MTTIQRPAFRDNLERDLYDYGFQWGLTFDGVWTPHAAQQKARGTLWNGWSKPLTSYEGSVAAFYFGACDGHMQRLMDLDEAAQSDALCDTLARSIEQARERKAAAT